MASQLEEPTRPTIYVVGDHGLVTDALRTLLEGAGFAQAGASATLHEAARVLLTRPASAILVDVPLGEGEAHQWLVRLFRTQPALRAAALRAGDGTWLFSVSSQGATRRVMLGRVDGRSLVALLADAVRRGDHTLHELLRRVRTAPRPAAAPAPATAPNDALAKPLTRRERDLLRLLGRGVTANRQLAAALGVSENTVKYHLRNLLTKMQVHRRAEAIAFAVRAGLIQVEALPAKTSDPFARARRAAAFEMAAGEVG